jgi:rare lipoprotein A (peptidoglycan hydrolase)
LVCGEGIVSEKKSLSKQLLNKVTSVLLASVLLLLGTAAFADFVPPESRILGVGRIQSEPITNPTTPSERLVMPTQEEGVTTVSSSDLVTPIDREVKVEEPAPQVIAPVQQAAGNTTGGSTSSNEPSGWYSGRASAYGLYDGLLGSGTATGDKVYEDSMGVAVPVGWYYLLGRHVEIEYKGIVVVALINDTGPFAYLGRVLDLQPGVFKAFGFDSEDAWGVRTVNYRILD